MNENECDYKEKDRRLKEQCINSINDDDIMIEIIKELTSNKRRIKLPVVNCYLGPGELRHKGPQNP